MQPELLAEELKSIRKRYMNATFSLDIFVRDSLKGINKKAIELRQTLSELQDLPSFSVNDLARIKGKEKAEIPKADEDMKPIIEMALNDNLLIVEPHTRMLLEMSIVYAGALFDGLVSDVLTTVFRHVPEALRSGRTLTTAEVLSFPSRERVAST
jgi:hypothetical protein